MGNCPPPHSWYVKQGPVLASIKSIWMIKDSIWNDGTNIIASGLFVTFDKELYNGIRS